MFHPHFCHLSFSTHDCLTDTMALISAFKVEQDLKSDGGEGIGDRAELHEKCSHITHCNIKNADAQNDFDDSHGNILLAASTQVHPNKAADSKKAPEQPVGRYGGL